MARVLVALSLLGALVVASACEEARRPLPVSGSQSRRDTGPPGETDGASTGDPDGGPTAPEDGGPVSNDDARPATGEDARPSTGEDARVRLDASTDCREVACTGQTYCERTTGRCLPGCDDGTQCRADQRCDLPTHTCECTVGELECGGTCTLCPADPGISSLTCSGSSCVAAGCTSNYVRCGNSCCPSTPMWQVETVAVAAGAASSLLVDAAGTPMVAYFSDNPRGVYFRTRAGGTWSQPQTVDSSLNALEPVMIPSLGGLVITNSVTNLNDAWIATAHQNGNGWSPEAVVIGPDRPDIATAGGVEHLVAVTRVVAGSSSLIYATRAAGSRSWSGQIPLASGVDWSFARVAATSNRVFVLYTAGNRLYLGQLSPGGGNWSTRQIVNGEVWDFDLTVDAVGNANVFYYLASSAALYFEVWDSSGFRSRQALVESTAPSPGGGAVYAGLALTHDGARVHLIYLGFSQGNALRYAVDSGGFVPETVTIADGIYGHPSIAVDAMGAPHVTFPLPTGTFPNLGYAVKR